MTLGIDRRRNCWTVRFPSKYIRNLRVWLPAWIIHPARKVSRGNRDMGCCGKGWSFGTAPSQPTLPCSFSNSRNPLKSSTLASGSSTKATALFTGPRSTSKFGTLFGVHSNAQLSSWISSFLWSSILNIEVPRTTTRWIALQTGRSSSIVQFWAVWSASLVSWQNTLRASGRCWYV